MTRFMVATSEPGMAPMYPNASAVRRQANDSRADPNSVRYRTVRTRPNEPLPSARLSTTLLAARRSCRARSESLRSMPASNGRIPTMASSMSS
jgi:hypothetical protein